MLNGAWKLTATKVGHISLHKKLTRTNVIATLKNFGMTHHPEKKLGLACRKRKLSPLKTWQWPYGVFDSTWLGAFPRENGQYQSSQHEVLSLQRIWWRFYTQIQWSSNVIPRGLSWERSVPTRQNNVLNLVGSNAFFCLYRHVSAVLERNHNNV